MLVPCGKCNGGGRINCQSCYVCDGEGEIHFPLASILKQYPDCITYVTESRKKAKNGITMPGGQCGCCGLSPKLVPGNFWIIRKAGVTDADGVYYSQLCFHASGEGCWTELTNAAKERKERAKKNPLEGLTYKDKVHLRDFLEKTLKEGKLPLDAVGLSAFTICPDSTESAGSTYCSYLISNGTESSITQWYKIPGGEHQSSVPNAAYSVIGNVFSADITLGMLSVYTDALLLWALKSPDCSVVLRDEKCQILGSLLGDDIDGMQSMMDD